MIKPTVLDVFCGAGGFSEGFRQQGFKIVMGIDKWEPAVKTFNHNFGLNCPIKNVLDFEGAVEEIEALPDTDVIIGSPPCVTFSSSNISGKADKSSGIKLTEIFLRIVAVKKWQKNSKLKAWYMENVPSSRTHLNGEYTFEELALEEWASKNRIGKSKVAIRLDGNQPLINSAYYGTPQARKRAISGEIIQKKGLIVPPFTNRLPDDQGDLPEFRTLGYIKSNLPKPNDPKSEYWIVDPLYLEIKIKAKELSDHFYDTGLFKCEWRQSKFLKINHPYMGKMSFPENEDKPSRTITANTIGTSRESIIYRSELTRKGNGEYRIPTVREAACLMGFPITFQFIGSEGIKNKLVGNAVCPSVSRAFAKQLRENLNLPVITTPFLTLEPNLQGINNLNTYTDKVFKTPPSRYNGSRFRRHPFKDGYMTVTLSNYDIGKNEKKISEWITSVQYGNGEGFPTFNFPDGYYESIERIIKDSKKGKDFLKKINNGFAEKVSKSEILQEMYEIQQSKNGYLEPTILVENIGDLINKLKIDDKIFNQNDKTVFKNKENVPLKQLYALYAINLVSTLANRS